MATVHTLCVLLLLCQAFGRPVVAPPRPPRPPAHVERAKPVPPPPASTEWAGP